MHDFTVPQPVTAESVKEKFEQLKYTVRSVTRKNFRDVDVFEVWLEGVSKPFVVPVATGKIQDPDEIPEPYRFRHSWSNSGGNDE